MDVPFVSSGALSRAHYAIVRKVELESSAQVVDQLLLDEVQRIRRLLLEPATSLARCKECLVILLYCAMTSPMGVIDNSTLYFALPYALNLAEAGMSIDAKRIGYLFCSEVMPATHELQLMLVNTLRKDLESPLLPRICLALDNIISLANDILAPAVQTRLRDLLSYKVAHVRRRALLAFRSLAKFQPDMLEDITHNLTLRLKDPDQTVSSTALNVVSAVSESNIAADHIHNGVTKMLQAQVTRNFDREVLLRVLQNLYNTQVSEDNTLLVVELLQRVAGEHYPALLLALFRVLSRAPSSTLASRGTSFILSCIDSFRGFLTSREPNDVYLFLSCLECIDPMFWSGKSPNFPAVLEGWEVECIMRQVDSDDESLRRKTLRILQSIDPDILNAHYDIKLRAMNSNLHNDALQTHILRLFEIVNIQSSEDGEAYARHIHSILSSTESVVHSVKHIILETAMESILLQIRLGHINFRIGCASTLLTILGDTDTPFGATMMVITTVIAAEYCHLVSIHPSKLLSGLASRLESHRPLVQDACLLAMLRVSIECDEITDTLKNTIQNLREKSKIHIRRRCDQFLALSGERQTLVHLVQDARSASLPDFAEALERYNTRRANPINEEGSTAASTNASPSGTTLSSSALRYAAYDTPQWMPRLREQRDMSATKSVDSSRSDETEGDNVLSRTITAGDLALAAGTRELEAISQVGSKAGGQMVGLSERTKTNVNKMKEEQFIEEISDRVDLIALDSPFMSEGPGEKEGNGEDMEEEGNFEGMWEALGEESGIRGWHSGSIEKVVGELQDLNGQQVKVISGDVPRSQAQGETKVAITRGPGKDGGALLRLRRAEEGGCVWRMRSRDGELKRKVKSKLWE